MDSTKLKNIISLSKIQIRTNGAVSASLTLEMIEYIRQLERNQKVELVKSFPVKNKKKEIKLSNNWELNK